MRLLIIYFFLVFTSAVTPIAKADNHPLVFKSVGAVLDWGDNDLRLAAIPNPLKSIYIPSRTYTLGGKGPGGGVVFNVDGTGLHGLEAKPADYKQPLTWTEILAAVSSYGSDWRVPTKDELNLLYQQKAVVGGFADGYYWSSTEFDTYNAWAQHFSNGYRTSGYYKASMLRIRPVRAF